MARRYNLVIDTNIIQSAGVSKNHDARPAQCARFLHAVVKHGHGVAVSRSVFDEWNRHRSRFAVTWLRVMFGKKRVTFVQPAPIDFEKHAPVTMTDKNRQALLKDRHLIETAVASDRRVTSLDDLARGLFRAVAKAPALSVIATVLWVNPTALAERCLEWIAAGAPDEKKRRLA